ncbi:MAG: hypothetical protein LBB81_10160 [Treponema sp.]|jgi:hypothetical protein|nr:hypothetical protein [Treponema sp.]
MKREISPVKSRWFLTACIVLVSVLFLNSCDELAASSSSNYKSFDYGLRGTWFSNESGLYSGTLKIDFDTITIDGYGEDWTSLVGDDSKRPFKDYPKRVPLKGYSEEGKIFIEYGGTVNGIPYIYEEKTYPQKYKLLEFTFGGRKEILQLID